MSFCYVVLVSYIIYINIKIQDTEIKLKHDKQKILLMSDFLVTSKKKRNAHKRKENDYDHVYVKVQYFPFKLKLLVVYCILKTKKAETD